MKHQPTEPFRVLEVVNLVGISYRQLDYWARTGLVRPSVNDAQGSGTQRLYSFRDVVFLRVIKRMLDVGVTLQQVRRAFRVLRDIDRPERGTTLVTDGHRTFAASIEQVVDLLESGAEMFAIPLDRIWTELEAQVGVPVPA